MCSHVTSIGYISKKWWLRVAKKLNVFNDDDHTGPVMNVLYVDVNQKKGYIRTMLCVPK